MPTLPRGLGRALLAASALAAATGLVASPGGAASPDSVEVWFLQGEQVIAVQRPGATQADAIRALLAGPTAAETKRGVRTCVPAGTPLGSG